MSEGDTPRPAGNLPVAPTRITGVGHSEASFEKFF